MTLYKWSQSASENATADASVNYREGQAPPTLNDAARAYMAAIAKWRDDISGGAVTDGASTGTAYVLYSSQGFDTLAHAHAQAIAFTPVVTNSGAVTLSVDGLASKPLRPSPGVELISGTLLAGTPYAAVYNNTDGAFYLSGYRNPQGLVPLGALLDFADDVLPSSAWAYANGQAVSRTTYAALFALIGSTFGAGDGSTTFNLPDCRGRAIFGLDNMGGAATANRLAADSTMASVRHLLGGAGGTDHAMLVASQIPDLTSPGSTSYTFFGVLAGTYLTDAAFGGNLKGNASNYYVPLLPVAGGLNVNVSGTGTVVADSTGTGGSNPWHNNVPPCVIMNQIIRVI